MMFKKLIRSIFVMLSMLSLTACSDDPNANSNQYYDNIGMIVSDQSNQPIYDLSFMNDYIVPACYLGGNAIIVAPDGNPDMNKMMMNIAPLTPNRNQSFHEAEANTNASIIIKTMKEMKAKTTEVDLFRALGLISTNLTGNHNCIIIVHNGLNTKAPLDMSKYHDINDFKGQEQLIIEQLKQMNCIYDFSSVDTIYWAGFGEVDGSQSPLTSITYEVLKGFYESYFNACKTKVEWITIGSKNHTDFNDLPAISNVNIAELQNITLQDLSATYLEETVGFQVGTDQFIDRNKAMSAISELVSNYQNYTKTNGLTKLLICGCSNEPEGTTLLANQRAIAIKNLLVESGIPENQLIIKALGSSNPWYDPNNINANRRIQIMAYDSKEAKSIMIQS